MHGRCMGTNKDGSPCGAQPLASGWYRWHDPSLVTERAAWRARGGSEHSNLARAARLMPAQLRPVFEDLIAAMGEVRRGTLSTRQGAALASLAGAAVLAALTAVAEPGSLTLCLSPSERQSAELHRKAKDALGALGIRAAEFERDNILSTELGNGSRVVALPGKEATIRGFSGARLLLVDEAARVPDALYM